jgi:hypothetical protein
MDDKYNLSDIKAVTEGAGGLDGGLIWVFVLYLLMFTGGGFGFNGRGAEIQQGFDTAEITRKLDGITNGLCDGFYAQNTTMLTGFNTLGSQLAQCCCETNRNIDAVRYENAKNTCDITTAIHAEGEATRALIQQNEMQALRDKVHYLEQNAALCGVVRYPTSMTYNAGGSPFCNYNGCACAI